MSGWAIIGVLLGGIGLFLSGIVLIAYGLRFIAKCVHVSAMP